MLNGADEVFKIAHSRNSDGQDDSDGKVAEDWDVVRLIPPPPPIEYRLWRSNPEKADQTIAAGALKTIAMATVWGGEKQWQWRDTEIGIVAMARYLDNGSAKDDFWSNTIV